MTDTLVRPVGHDERTGPEVVAEPATPSMTPVSGRDVMRITAGVAAIAAGVIDAAMIGAYTGRGVAPTALAVAAVVALATGVAVMVRPVRVILAVVVAAHVALVAGWIALGNGGVSFIRGLDHTRPFRYPEAVAVGFSAIVVLAAVTLWRRPRRSQLPSGVAVAVLVPLVAAFLILGGPAAYLAATRSGSQTVASGDGAGSAGSAGTGATTGATADATTPTLADGTEDHSHHHVTAKPYDPTKPIDLSGTAGVTMVQQKEAELLLAQTQADLPKYADESAAEAAGYRSIGDSFTGDEHLVNWGDISDSHVLDPNFPESLVYDTHSGGRPKLEAAMFIMPDGYTLDNVPDIGGGLIQWHIHDNLCMTEGDAPQVAGFVPCSPGTSVFTPHPMIHVWITANPCGPFSALEGVGAGQTKSGVHDCDHVHGSTSTSTGQRRSLHDGQPIF
jgi:hypothetical protein